MKTLYLVRHAKSSWKDEDLTDFERPLNTRGRRDAPFIGKLLAQKGVKADLLISSPATRAIVTARFIAEELLYPRDLIRADAALYDADVPALLRVVQGIEPSCHSVMLFGHNPEFTELIRTLTGADLENLPTCGVFGIRFNIELWSSVGDAQGEQILFEFPKKYTPATR